MEATTYNTDGNMASLSPRMLKHHPKQKPRSAWARFLYLCGYTMESFSSLLEIVPLYQLKEVIHAYRNAEDFGRMLKRRPSYTQLEQIRRLADVHPEDLQDLIDEFREYQASYRGHSNRFLKSRVMIGELMGALRGDHPPDIEEIIKLPVILGGN